MVSTQLQQNLDAVVSDDVTQATNPGPGPAIGGPKGCDAGPDGRRAAFGGPAEPLGRELGQALFGEQRGVVVLAAKAAGQRRPAVPLERGVQVARATPAFLVAAAGEIHGA